MTESWNPHGQVKHLFGCSAMMPAGYAGVIVEELIKANINFRGN